MTPSPNRVFAVIILAAVAGSGLLLLVVVALVTLGAGPAREGARTLRCLVAPVSSLDTVVHASALLIALFGGGVLLAMLRATSREQARMAELRQATMMARLSSPPHDLVGVATRVGVADRLDLVEAVRPFAFAYGWLRPRICVSTGLIERLTLQELEAVLHHEQWHVVRRDSIRLLVVRVIVTAFGFTPPIRRLGRHYMIATEVAADRYTVATMGHPRALASALTKIIATPVTMSAFEGYAEARIAALAGEPLPATQWGCRLVLGVLALDLLVLVPLLATSGATTLAPIGLHPIC